MSEKLKIIVLTPEEIYGIKDGKPKEELKNFTFHFEPKEGDFDFEKGAAIDFPMSLYNEETNETYEGFGDNYYTAVGGIDIYEDITFTLVK